MMDTVIQIPKEFQGKGLYAVLLDQGIPFSAPCGGNGTCGKCRVRLLEGVLWEKNSGRPLVPDAQGYLLACHAVVSDTGCTVAIPALTGDGLTLSDGVSADGGDRLGVALDIGTTTLAVALVDLDTETVLKSASCLNP
ncbi:MAG: 2Fe-2S iron-sulfur cluster binding domain-containing protein [Clostridia bacterium]|nr:2Fe-2S iron-sulfur cluster binding domain-containing protein [Clostridia bacterium]